MNASFGSQGQQRSLILSLKMAEIALIKKVTGEFPILLLDDVMSELDNHRQLKLLESIDEEVQTFMTTTSLDHLFFVIDTCDKRYPISCKSFSPKPFYQQP